MKYILNDNNFVINIVVGTKDQDAIEAERGAGKIGDYYTGGVFYPTKDGQGGVLCIKTLTYSYDAESIAAKKAALISQISLHCEEQDAKSFEYPAGSGLFYKFKDAIYKTLQRSICLADTDPIPCNDGKWDTADGATSTDFTVSELRALYDYGYDIPVANRKNKKKHVAAVQALKTMQALVNYNYSTGWSS